MRRTEADFPLKASMFDVYQENESVIEVWVRPGHDGSLIIDDSPDIDGGTFNIIIENREGIPYLMVWLTTNFGNDPLYTIKLESDFILERGEKE
jgi:hypothetical protein